MQPFKIHILGCGSALPTAKHNPSSQIVEIRGKLFMVDCGEGTQLQIRKSRLNFSKLYAVFISHLHGDHVLGLVGMLSTFGLNGRTAPLNIYAPGEYEELLRMELKMFCSNLDYEIIFHPLDTRKQQIIYEDRSLTVETIPLHHRMPCAGFLFREKPGDRHIRRDMIDFYRVPVSQINNIKIYIKIDLDEIVNEKYLDPHELNNYVESLIKDDDMYYGSEEAENVTENDCEIVWFKEC